MNAQAITTANLHESFLSYLPTLEAVARGRFRKLDPEARQEAVQNTTALAWAGWVKMVEQHEVVDAGLLKSVAWYAVLHTKVGRAMHRSKAGRDACDRRPVHLDLDAYVSHSAPIPDQVAFRMDIPQFFQTLSDYQRALAEDLATGMTTSEAAQQHGVSAAAVSQFRSRFKVLLDRFYEAA